MAGIIITSLIMLLFIGMGILLSQGKGAFLIAGYNTMSKEEQEKYDVLALCKFMGKMMFLFAFSMGFWILGEIYESTTLFIVGTVIFLAVTAIMLVFMNTNNRFKK